MKTYYEILGFSSEDHKTITLDEIKKAYRAALLSNHPDKSRNGKLSVDDIQAAYAILSNQHKRSAYDQALQGSNYQIYSKQEHSEVYDLDDLEYDEKLNEWFMGCRCGNKKGFTVNESILEDNIDIGEILIQCLDCSNWIKVQFQENDHAHLE
ncbi:hypothetical protein CANCADRAFT_44398 [Tortispora caseinolytica NRRL Y-17796]|uniref:Diphthamide biosynthesis protein 4 n=1 Tax=Tortispora caseinolytica NRRL Y-17796 TaxID=767744 RepID=A0A1E4TGB1_9ASCO|nr:hypothetical protein CANCADRAFT_44398 [Tortispora caseinolytica NRRL Y-17796]